MNLRAAAAWPRRRLTRVLVRALLAVATCLAVTIAGVTPGRAAPDPSPGPAPTGAPTLTLVSQTTWVTGGGATTPDFRLSVAVSGATPAGSRVQVSIYQHLVSRSDYVASVSGKVHGLFRGPLSMQGSTTQPGAYQLALPVNPTQGGQSGNVLRLTTPGVYPVQVTLEDRAGQVQARLTTHLLYTGKGPLVQERLRVSWLISPHAAPALSNDGQPVRLPPASSQALTDLLNGLADRPEVAVTLAPTPQTLDALAGGGDAEKAALGRLTQRLATGVNGLVTRPYVDLSTAAMTAAGLDGELIAQIRRGAAEINATLHRPPAAQPWVETGALTPAAVEAIYGRGVGRLVVDQAALAPLPAGLNNYTLGQPFQLSGRPGHRLTAVSLDAGLGSHFANGGDQPLAAHQLLADLAMIQQEQPNAVRGVAMAAPPSWDADRTFVATLLEGLATSPFLAPVTADRLFNDVPVLRDRVGPVVRPLSDQQAPIESITDNSAIRAARTQLDSFASVVPTDPGLPGDLDKMLLTAESADIKDRQRPALVAAVTRRLSHELGLVHLPPDQSIRLTARQGNIPITVVSSAPYSARVRIKVSSPKLKFQRIVVVGGSCRPGATAESCVLDLHNQNTTLKVPVLAPTPGVYPLTIQLTAPDGGVLASAKYTVRSTAASGVGIFLSIGAACLLVLWWGRELRHGRRRRGLVPGPDPEGAEATPEVEAGPEFGSDEWVYRQLGLEWPPPPAPAGTTTAAEPSWPTIVRPLSPLTPALDLDPITAPIPIVSFADPPMRARARPVAPAARMGPGTQPPGLRQKSPVTAPPDTRRLRPPPGLTPGAGGAPPRRPVQPDRHLPSSFGRNTKVMAGGTLLSRLTGFGRVLALVWAFHFTGLADAYNLANNVPNILYDLVLGGVLSATLVPVFVDYLNHEDEDEGWRAISAVCTAIVAVLAALTLLFWLLVPVIIRFYLVLNPHATDERAIGTSLLRLFVPQLFLLGGIAVSTALLNARRHFLAPAFSPVLNNVVTIAALVGTRLIATSLNPQGFRHDTTAILLLGLGTTAGYLVQLVVQLPSMFRGRFHLRPVWDLHHPAVRTVLRLSMWTFGSVMANQVAFNLVLVLAAHKSGDVTVFQTGYQFFQLPYAIFAVSIASVITPDLSERWSRRDLAGFRGQMASGLRLTLALLIPAAVGYILLAHPLLTLVFRHGTVSGHDAHRVGTVVALFALGLPGFSAYLLLMRGYQAMQDTKSMFFLYAVENAATIVLALILYPLMGVGGLAVGWVAAYTLGTGITFWHLRTRTGGLDGRATMRTVVRVGLATAVMAAGVGAVRLGLDGSTDSRLILECLVAVTVGTGLYVIAARALGLRELDVIVRRRR